MDLEESSSSEPLGSNGMTAVLTTLWPDPSEPEPEMADPGVDRLMLTESEGRLADPVDIDDEPDPEDP